MATTGKGERFDVSPGYNYLGGPIQGTRRRGEMFGELRTTGRNNAADRQHVADSMATITETATITLTAGKGANAIYRVDFTVTHRIVPIGDLS